MQYLFSGIFDKAGLATPAEMAAIDVFNDRLQTEGHWVFAGGLESPSSATVIDNRGGEVVFTDGHSGGSEPMRRTDAAEATVACVTAITVSPSPTRSALTRTFRSS